MIFAANQHLAIGAVMIFQLPFVESSNPIKVTYPKAPEPIYIEGRFRQVAGLPLIDPQGNGHAAGGTATFFCRTTSLQG